MASFRGTVRLESDLDTVVRALVNVDATLVSLVVGDDELGSWPRSDITVHALEPGFLLVADGERLVIDVVEASAFGAAVGLDPRPERSQKRPAPASPAAARPERRRLFGRRKGLAEPPRDAPPETAVQSGTTVETEVEPEETTVPPEKATAPPRPARAPAPLEPPPPPSPPPAFADAAVVEAPEERPGAPAAVGAEGTPTWEADTDVAPAAEQVPRDEAAHSMSAELQTLRERSTIHYTEDEVLKRPIGVALAVAGLGVLVGAIMTWGAARLTRGSFAVGRVLAGIGALFAVLGAYLGLFNEQRRAGAWGAVAGGSVALVVLVLAARQARIGWGFILAFIGTIAVLALGVISLLDWAAAPPQRRQEEDG